MTKKKTETPDTDPQLPVVEAVQSKTGKGQVLFFGAKLEVLMEYANRQAQISGDYQDLWAEWHTKLENIWREVHQHVE